MGGVDQRFRVLVAATAVSAYGNYLNLITLSLFSYEVTGTAFGVGAVMATRMASGFLAGLAAGALSAKVTRRTMMICVDVAQGSIMGVLALCASHTPLFLLLGAVVVLGAGNTLFTVALRSAVPLMVGQEARSLANGLLVTARSLATVLGFASAAPVVGFGGYALAFAMNGMSFAVSAAALLVLRPRTDSEADGASAGSDSRGSAGSLSLVRRGMAGLPVLLLGMIVLRGVDALASSSHNVALPLVAHASAPSEPAVFMTQFWAVWAVGTVLAHQMLKLRQSEAVRGERAFAVGTCAMSLSFVAAFTESPTWALMAAAVSAGFADGCTEIIYTSRLQAAPDRQRGLLFGLSATAEQFGFALGTVTAAAALEVLTALAVVGIFHGTAVCGALGLLLVSAHRRSTGPAKSSTNALESQGEDCPIVTSSCSGNER
ncbi:MFS family permease [Streptomyces umbrinus]|uniref:MFS family permease n=1 Tax=Streptomyces umbrinus TaxID=67370 RepID=A0ABU0SMI9_9ACTN|nr:MFS transporter [Streptomyces umbrinus]MDQ1024745.1 MFS family permease [Streptomyces umbrinus]